MSGPRFDPANDVRVNPGAIDVGDNASTLIFNEDMGPDFSVALLGGGDPAYRQLEGIASTGDDKWSAGFVDDGQNKNRLDITDANGDAADDLVMLLEEAIEGNGDLSLTFDALDKVTIAVEGKWSTDLLVFEGDFVTHALMDVDTGFDLFNPKNQLKVFCFDDPDRNESIYTGRTDNLDQSEGAIGEILNGSFLDEVEGKTKAPELKDLIFAAMDEKFGLDDTKDLTYVTDDGESIIVQVTNQHWRGPATDTMILKGGDVAAILDEYADQFRSGLDTGDGHSRLAYYDTDANTGGKGGVWFGGGVNHVTFDTDELINLNDVVGNGLTQRENNPNRAWEDDIDEFIFHALEYNGESDVSVIAGGQLGDDYMSIAMQTKGGNTDTLLLEGDRVGEAIDHWHNTGSQYDFFG